MTSQALVAALCEAGVLPIPADAVARLGAPPPLPFLDPDRIEGMLLGLAIGDALGNHTEGWTPGARRAQHGEIVDYLPSRHADGRAAGVPSDDTQLAFWTLEHLLEHGRIVPEALARTFASRRIFGIGHAVRRFVDAMHAGTDWSRAAQPSAGNGALMRVAPVILPHLQHPSPALWADAILAGAVTHTDASSIAACVAFTGLLWEVLGRAAAPAPAWWLDTYVARARLLEGDRALRPRHPALAFRGPVWRLVDTEGRRALAEDLTVLEAGEWWYSGAYLLETVPMVLHLLARHADDPERALVRAVNDTKDSDTAGAIVGAAVGALHGRRALPARWVDGLLGRTEAHDDGRVFALIRDAVARVLPGSR